MLAMANGQCPVQCPPAPEPVECNWETETICPVMDGNGCHLGDTCMPMQTGECWNMCPMTCLAQDVLCANPPDSVTGCDTGSFCMLASEGCPVICPTPELPTECNWETEIQCNNVENDCYLGVTCVPIQTGECWNECPVNCMAGEIACSFGVDENGCDLGYYCFPMQTGECWNECPVDCMAGEIACSIGVDENGCDLGNYCLPMQTGECWNECPVNCMAGEIACSNGVDENGCDLGSYCLSDVQK
jgi:hypothetical protein